jgi:ParB/RepB/Spo0J family partition protein
MVKKKKGKQKMITRETTVPVATLSHAPWNPREQITPESVADLMASIEKHGLLQAIGVWYDADDDKTYVIYGNRRFVACQSLGMKTIPANIFTGITKKEAKEITRIENEQRMGISPIKDAELVGEMLDLGITEEEIAATFGVSVATVCRRAKLLGLEKAVVDFAKVHNVSADALERIALYPPEIQVDVINEINEEEEDLEGLIRWGDLSYLFQASKRILKNAPWAKDESFMSSCSHCIFNTCTSRDLFGDIESIENGEATCLDSKCYKKKEEEWRLACVRAKVPDGMDIVMVSSWVDYGIYITNKVPSEENNVAYCLKWGDVEVRFAPPPQKLEEMKREREEARQIEAMKAREEREREDEQENKLNELLERFYNGLFHADEGDSIWCKTLKRMNEREIYLLAITGLLGKGDLDRKSFSDTIYKMRYTDNTRDEFVGLLVDIMGDTLEVKNWQGCINFDYVVLRKLYYFFKILPSVVEEVYAAAGFTQEEICLFDNAVLEFAEELVNDVDDEEDEDIDEEEDDDNEE